LLALLKPCPDEALKIWPVDRSGTVTPLVLTPAEFGAYMTAETAKWAKVIKLANIKAE
jgi:hypothetical protein